MSLEKLKNGDTIGLFSPCYSAKNGQYSDAVSTLTKMGYSVKLARNIYKDTYGYSASEEERADDFNELIKDPKVKMILFGGGFVGNEILPLIDFDNIIKNPKYILSYSDGTSILDSIYVKTGLVTYYGQKPSTFYELTNYNKSQFEFSFIKESPKEFISNSEWVSIVDGTCEGILVGGYIENMAMLINSSYFPYSKKNDYILFLEDYEKFNPPAKISMYLSHIEQSELCKHVKGLLFGHYSETKNSELISRLKHFGEKNKVPVISCDDFGHGVNNAVVPIGVKAKLDTKNGLYYLD